MALAWSTLSIHPSMATTVEALLPEFCSEGQSHDITCKDAQLASGPSELLAYPQSKSHLVLGCPVRSLRFVGASPYAQTLPSAIPNVLMRTQQKALPFWPGHTRASSRLHLGFLICEESNSSTGHASLVCRPAGAVSVGLCQAMKSLSVMQEPAIVSTSLIKWVSHADAITGVTRTEISPGGSFYICCPLF